MQLENSIRTALSQRPILLMTHLVLGYPSFAVNREVIGQMVDSGVDLIEMQIPFSEPVADGPMILKANQAAITSGVRVEECLEFAAEMTAAHRIPFLFMTYYNILFKYGVERFVRRAKEIGIQGFIVPDLPPEEGAEYLALAKAAGLAPIQIFAPTSTPARMSFLAGHGAGFIYCVARRGVTGRKTEFDAQFGDYMARCRAATDLPLAVGFGIREKADVDSLIGRADIAVIGTETIRLVEAGGAAAVGPFITGLRD
ncbi:MAG: tryptophan synthase subunit alpha [Deltaproteobacteria bacterium RIFOXYD12_FULL_57_12]|nr:MAG: tryptophan synthase subunit alpha [Deltaproteobacteria bacterium RIFOXYD12_FULL_57_12]